MGKVAFSRLVIGISLFRLSLLCLFWTAVLDDFHPVQAEPAAELETSTTTALDLGQHQDLVHDSPVLRRWLEEPPDLLQEIRNTPVVPTRLQVSLQSTTWSLGVEDLRLGDRFTLSGDYQQSRERSADQGYGSLLRYYIAPRGSRMNLAPQVGYRAIQEADRSLSGPQFGAFVLLALAPQAADLTLSYSWLTPKEVGVDTATLATITAAYALSPSTRIAARYQRRNSTISQDGTFGVVLEWIP
ncbi:MAG: hypothetical protein HC921_04575 [Synechococcaceae cyanobacterium SM2_3_1]|nr:hypothetical protein [Synechococcaceae cyanobacterium SM2_3_1]